MRGDSTRLTRELQKQVVDRLMKADAIGDPLEFYRELIERARDHILNDEVPLADIKISKSLFSYQIFMVARPLPSLEVLLEGAMASGESRAAVVTQRATNEAPAATLQGTPRPRGDSKR